MIIWSPNDVKGSFFWLEIILGLRLSNGQEGFSHGWAAPHEALPQGIANGPSWWSPLSRNQARLEAVPEGDFLGNAWQEGKCESGGEEESEQPLIDLYPLLSSNEIKSIPKDFLFFLLSTTAFLISCLVSVVGFFRCFVQVVGFLLLIWLLCSSKVEL